MSAQALLASILPIAPAPKGPAAPAAADEGVEFAAMVETEAEAAPAEAATAKTEADVKSPAPAVTNDAPTDAAVPALSLIVVAPVVPVALPAEIAAVVVAEAEAPVESDAAPPPPLVTAAPQPEPMPANAQDVLPPTQARKADTTTEADTPAPAPADDGEDVAAKPEPQASEGKQAKAEPVVPPPLKPLPERTSRRAEPGQPALDSASRAEGQRPEGAATPQAPGTPAIPAAASAHGQAKAGRAEPTATADPSTPTADIAGSTEPHAAPEQSVAAHVREAAAGLSRVAVEATAQIAAQILRKLEGRSTRFEMALLPEELGRVDVKLDIDSEGRLNARLAFDNPAAATDLRGRVDDLRRQLEQHGFELAADAFEFAERDPGSHAFDRGQENSGRGRAFAAAARLEADAEVAAVGRYAVSLSPSGVDVRV